MALTPRLSQAVVSRRPSSARRASGGDGLFLCRGQKVSPLECVPGRGATDSAASTPTRGKPSPHARYRASSPSSEARWGGEEPPPPPASLPCSPAGPRPRRQRPKSASAKFREQAPESSLRATLVSSLLSRLSTVQSARSSQSRPASARRSRAGGGGGGGGSLLGGTSRVSWASELQFLDLSGPEDMRQFLDVSCEMRRVGQPAGGPSCDGASSMAEAADFPSAEISVLRSLSPSGRRDGAPQQFENTAVYRQVDIWLRNPPSCRCAAGCIRQPRMSMAPGHMGEEPDPRDTLMFATLRCVDDTEEELWQTAAALEDCQVHIAELGGSHHATVHISARTEAVVRRKAELLAAVRGQIADLETAWTHREELYADCVERSRPLPAELLDVSSFLAAHVHRDENPAAADKCDFEAFLRSFGLPPGHQLVGQLKESSEQATDWWTGATTRALQAGVDFDAVQHLIGNVERMVGHRRHAVLLACKEGLIDREAGKVLVDARRLLADDDELSSEETLCGHDKFLIVGLASDVADTIHEMIRLTANRGVPDDHPCIVQAVRIVKELRRRDGYRRCVAAKQFLDNLPHQVLAKAKQLRASDDATADCSMEDLQASGKKPQIGLASEFADSIELEVECAVSAGVLPDHELLGEAIAIAKDLRFRNGQRKRLLSRHLRLAACSAGLSP